MKHENNDEELRKIEKLSETMQHTIAGTIVKRDSVEYHLLEILCYAMTPEYVTTMYVEKIYNDATKTEDSIVTVKMYGKVYPICKLFINRECLECYDKPLKEFEGEQLKSTFDVPEDGVKAESESEGVKCPTCGIIHNIADNN